MIAFFFFLLVLIISCSLFSLGPSSCSLALTMHKEQAAVGAGSCLPCGLLPTPLKQQNLQDSGWSCLGRVDPTKPIPASSALNPLEAQQACRHCCLHLLPELCGLGQLKNVWERTVLLEVICALDVCKPLGSQYLWFELLRRHLPSVFP